MTAIVLLAPKTDRAISRQLFSPPPEELLGRETEKLLRQGKRLQIPASPSTQVSMEESPAIWGQRPLAERLFDVRSAVKRLTAQVAMHLNQAWRDNLFRQIDDLHDPEEWMEGDEPVELPSFSSFLKAITGINPSRRPGLGLSDAGNLIAAWTENKDKLTVEFQQDGWVRYSISHYLPDDDGFEYSAGHIPLTKLSERLAAHHPEKWFYIDATNK